VKRLDGALVGCQEYVSCVPRSSSITSHLTLGRSIVLGLVELVGDGTGSTRDAVGDGVVAGDVALSLLLVGLLGGLSGLWWTC